MGITPGEWDWAREWPGQVWDMNTPLTPYDRGRLLQPSADNDASYVVGWLVGIAVHEAEHGNDRLLTLIEHATASRATS